ncbi:MAG TPA: HD domain-containing protein, partial [Longimicrobiales bacterium]
RRDHIGRVAALMDSWGEALGLEELDRRRWRAAAWLHDALRDAPPQEIRPLVPEPLRSLPGKLLHGPAAAARLRQEGVGDEPLLCAVAWHTLGHPDFDALGKALYLADFLEPGRGFALEHCASLRASMPDALDDVLRDVVAQRLHHALEMRHLLRPESVAFWNVLVEKP